MVRTKHGIEWTSILKNMGFEKNEWESGVEFAGFQAF